MKIFIPFAALGTLLLLAACRQDPQTPIETPPTETVPVSNPYLDELKGAEAGWQQLKSEYGSSYRYVTSGGAVWGPFYETTLTVEEEKVVQRDLSIIEIDENTGESIVTKMWSETGEAVGSHQDTGASEPVTVEAYFATCKGALDQPAISTYEVYLQYISPEGVTPKRETIIASCLAIPPGLVYDGGSPNLTTLDFIPSAE